MLKWKTESVEVERGKWFELFEQIWTFFTDKNRKNLKLLEATITGWVDFASLSRSYDPKANGANRLPAAQYEKVSKYLTDSQQTLWESGKMTFDELKHAVAHNLFIKASTYNEENYNNNKGLFKDPENLQFQQLDIELLRKQVSPING